MAFHVVLSIGYHYNRLLLWFSLAALKHVDAVSNYCWGCASSAWECANAAPNVFFSKVAFVGMNAGDIRLNNVLFCCRELKRIQID